jgi:glyoxylase I family protein
VRIHHLALRTADVARLVAFYRDVVGLAVTSRASEQRVWLSADDTTVMIERREPGEPEVPRGAMELVAFAIEPGERAAFVERLRVGEVALESETAFTLYFRDPDGRRVGVSHYPSPAPP